MSAHRGLNKEETVRQGLEKGLSGAKVGVSHLACINGSRPYPQTGESGTSRNRSKSRAISCVCAVRCGASKKNGIS